jgi:Fur family peroxide stress response transcriptional regulator
MIIRRKSQQRERIFNLIAMSKSHPTAQWIYDTLRKEMPTISLGNVYRNLNILLEEKRIVCREFGDNVDHYDAITTIHYHFVCEKCGNVSDFEMPIQEVITQKAQKISGHIIKGHSIQFFGICESCNHTDKNHSRKRTKYQNIPKRRS